MRLGACAGRSIRFNGGGHLHWHEGEPHLNRNIATEATLRPTRGWPIGSVRTRSNVQAVELVGERDADDRSVTRLAIPGTPKNQTHNLAKPGRVAVRPETEQKARQGVVAGSTLASGQAERDRLRVRAWRPTLCTGSESVGASEDRPRRSEKCISVGAGFELEQHEGNLKEQHQQAHRHI